MGFSRMWKRGLPAILVSQDANRCLRDNKIKGAYNE
jgi:hypothetical protein